MTGFDPSDPAFRLDPYPAYARLRARMPVVLRPDHGDAFVFRAADIRAGLNHPGLIMDGGRDRRDGPSWDEAAAIADPLRRRQALSAKAQAFHDLWFANLNPPEHEAVQRLFTPSFLPSSVEAMRRMIEDDVAYLLDGLAADIAAGNPVDLMDTFARRLPLRVIARILGLAGGRPGATDDLPRPDEDRLWAHTRSMMAGLDLDAQPRERALSRFGIIGLVEHVRPHLDHPARPGVIEALAGHCAAGRISRDEALANLAILLFAGNETTRQLIGATLFHLITRPELMADVAAEPALMPSVVAETVRFDPPVHYVVRRTAESMVIAGVLLPKGLRVRLMIGAAGRDGEAWREAGADGDDPECFAPGRRQPASLAFGRGPHHCLGMRLAQLEAVAAVSGVLSRYPRMRLAGRGAVWRPSVRARDLAHLMIVSGDRM